MSEAWVCTVRDDGPDEGGGSGAAAVSFTVTGANPVLMAMMAQGAKAIPVGCRGGGCGVCRVQVVDGDYETKRMSRRHVSEEDEAEGYALACRLVAHGDLTVRPALGSAVPRHPPGASLWPGAT